MEDEGLRITVVGAVLIIAVAIAVLLVVRALANKKDRGSEQDQPSVIRNSGWRNVTAE